MNIIRNALLIAFVLLLAFSCTAQKSVAKPNATPDTNVSTDLNISQSPAVLQAKRELADAGEAINKMRRSGLSTQRISDLLIIAKNTFQSELETAAQKKEKPDFTAFRQRLKEFNDVFDLAFTAHDELEALKSRIDKAATEVPDVKPAMDLYGQAQKELKDQRFERVMDLIEKADEKLLDLASLNTRAAAMYDAAVTNIGNFVNSHQTEIALVIVIPLVLGTIFRQQIKKYQYKSKISSLELERDTLKEEIKKAQQEYFVGGKISESVYTTRVTVFGDLIRDLTREIALLHEEQQKINIIKFLTLTKKTNPKTEKKGA